VPCSNPRTAKKKKSYFQSDRFFNCLDIYSYVYTLFKPPLPLATNHSPFPHPPRSRQNLFCEEKT
jgi:hypothetical protein